MLQEVIIVTVRDVDITLWLPDGDIVIVPQAASARNIVMRQAVQASTDAVKGPQLLSFLKVYTYGVIGYVWWFVVNAGA